MAGDKPAEDLAGKAGYEIFRAQDLAKEVARIAGDLAATEDAVAETMDAMAVTHPDDAGRYHALAEDARQQAARERQRARAYSRGTPPRQS